MEPAAAPHNPDPDRYDVVIIGGAFAGAATAMLLRRWRPNARVLIVERTEKFSRKVGEATVEVSALFLTRVLGLSSELARDHLPKHGLRFWFDNGLGPGLDTMDELGPNRLPGMHSFHMDRASLDQTLLDKARDAGAEVARPMKAHDIQLGWPESTLTLTPERGSGDGPDARTVRTRWVIDASGRACLLGRQLGLIEKVPDHPIASAWARWTGVADLDGQAVLGPDPRNPRLQPLSPSRGLSTNHFCGKGWWAWLIPLAGGQSSVGLTYDKRLFEPPGAGKLRDRYEAFLRAQPGLGELLQNASVDGDDFLAYKDLAYRSTQYADRGWALVGDAAAFLDPLYSSGLDHVAFSTYATARLIEQDLAPPEAPPESPPEVSREAAPKAFDLDPALSKHNADFQRSYDRWLKAVYLGKYELFGDAELMSASYFLDIGTYYLGVVGSVYRDVDNYREPVLGTDAMRATMAWKSMAAIKGRMIRLARKRRALGITAGPGPRREKPWRQYPTRFALGATIGRIIARGLWLYLRAEVQTLAAGLGLRRGPRWAPRQPQIPQMTQMKSN